MIKNNYTRQWRFWLQGHYGRIKTREGSIGIYKLLSKAECLRIIVDGILKSTSMSMACHYLEKLKPKFTWMSSCQDFPSNSKRW